MLLSAIVTVAQGQNSSPKSHNDFFRSSASDLVASFHLRPLGNKELMEKQISQAINSLHIELPPSKGVWVCHGCGTASHPQLGIIVDPDQLLSIQQLSHVSDMQQLLVFVLAHEYAHQQQYDHYQIEFGKLTTEDREAYEAQADILGAITLFESLPRNASPGFVQSVFSVVRAIYDLGGEEYSLGDHPSRTGRLLSCRIGLEYAAIIDMMAHGGAPWEQLEKIDFKNNESPLHYSLRMARSIVQSNRMAARDLVYVFNIDDLKWDTRSDHPVVAYDLRYENRGTKALLVTLQVECLAVDRREPENIFKMKTSSAKFHTFRVEPGTPYQVKGQLSWLATANQVPRFINPPDPQGLIEVHYADGSDTPQDNPALLSEDMRVATLAEINTMQFGLNRLVEASHTGYAEVATGIGTAYHETHGVSFPANMPLTGAFSASVRFPTDFLYKWSPKVTSTFLITYDANESKVAYAHLVETVRAALPLVTTTDGSHVWIESEDANHVSTVFRHAPFYVEIERKVEMKPISEQTDVEVDYVNMSFGGLLTHPAANNAGAPFIDDPDDGEDSDLSTLLELAGHHQLGKLKAVKSDSAQTSKTWDVLNIAARFGECTIDDDQFGESSLSCSRRFTGLSDAKAMARALEVAARNSNAVLDYATADKDHIRMRLWGQAGSMLEIKVWLPRNELQIHLSPYSPG
jgi:hypothetical protein